MMARSPTLQRKAGYIDARPPTASSSKFSCYARPDHTLGRGPLFESGVFVARALEFSFQFFLGHLFPVCLFVEAKSIPTDLPFKVNCHSPMANKCVSFFDAPLSFGLAGTRADQLLLSAPDSSARSGGGVNLNNVEGVSQVATVAENETATPWERIGIRHATWNPIRGEA